MASKIQTNCRIVSIASLVTTSYCCYVLDDPYNLSGKIIEIKTVLMLELDICFYILFCMCFDMKNVMNLTIHRVS